MRRMAQIEKIIEKLTENPFPNLIENLKDYPFHNLIDYPLQNIINVHNFIFVALIMIFIFVLTCYLSTIVVHRKKKSRARYPELKGQNHEERLELIWTYIPGLFILIFMLPSMALLYLEDNINRSVVTVNVIGNQWYWEYEVTTSLFSTRYASNLVDVEKWDGEANVKPLRLLTTDRALVLPVGVQASIYVTSNDVAHSWSLPALGVKVDALPGRINNIQIMPTQVGVYSGMCSELCGVQHGFMPIEVHVVTPQEWIEYYTDGGKKVLNHRDFIKG